MNSGKKERKEGMSDTKELKNRLYETRQSGIVG